MDLSLFARGAVIGLAIAAPVGPIGVLCIRRTLADGQLTGFVSGLGAATADLIYGSVAVLGLTALADLLVGVSFWTRLVGGLFLCYLGVRTLREVPAERPAEATARGLAGAYASTLLLTITNPATIIAFAAIFAGLGAASVARGYNEGLLLVAGVFAGSALWWLILSGATGLLRSRVTPRSLRWVNLAAGAIILGFGVVALGSLLVG
ncbi:MAG: LysE family transporter [Chloroflexales bacterium]|nr:LysE family transporter [Chloroflexales bacterium]